MSDVTDKYAIHPPTMRWTHIALPQQTSTRRSRGTSVSRRSSCSTGERTPTAKAHGSGTATRSTKPFILVLVSFTRDQARVRNRSWRHLLTSGSGHQPCRGRRDRPPRRSGGLPCVAADRDASTDRYICALTDPDGNMVEFSYDQGVYATVQEVWGNGS